MPPRKQAGVYLTRDYFDFFRRAPDNINKYNDNNDFVESLNSYEKNQALSDIKLFLDSFSTINKVSYDTYNQVPPQVIQFLSDYYGVELPNPYANEAPSRYKEGDNLQTEAGLGTPLETTLDTLWRRILINLPHLLRTRGTIAGVKALMNTIGIEADSVFRFKEYGGNLTKKIQSRRTRKKKR